MIMGKKGMQREKMVKMTSAIKCGALRQNLTAIPGLSFKLSGENMGQFSL
jgi:hypothetical protein